MIELGTEAASFGAVRRDTRRTRRRCRRTRAERIVARREVPIERARVAKARSLPRPPSPPVRLTRVRTTRPSAEGGTATSLFRDARVVQDLRYTYDAGGNVVRIEDAAHRTLLRGGTQVEPASEYTYDSTNRLVEATGREHVAQGGLSFDPPNGNYRDYPFVGHRAHANDLEALQGYVQRYEYDAEGNFELFRHIATSGGYTRQYGYSAPSLLEPGKTNNRVTSTQVGSAGITTERYTYDAHGNTLSMPHLARLAWDFEDQLTTASLGGGGTAHYVYDAAGQRVKKVIEAGSGVRTKERIYLGGFEIYREYGPDGVTVEEERETLHVMDDTRRIALVETKTVTRGRAAPETSVVRYQLANHLGSATLELDDAGAVIAYEEFHPYGTSAFQAGRSAAEVSFKRYRYTGLERDEETGFGYHAARYLAPWLGRWVSCDPSGLVDGGNLYGYVRCRPIGLVDRTGNEGDDWTKHAAYTYPTDEHDVLTPHPGVDTGNRALNVAANTWLSLSNLISIPINGASQAMSIPGRLARSSPARKIGVTEADASALDFAVALDGAGPLGEASKTLGEALRGITAMGRTRRTIAGAKAGVQLTEGATPAATNATAAERASAAETKTLRASSSPSTGRAAQSTPAPPPTRRAQPSPPTASSHGTASPPQAAPTTSPSQGSPQATPPGSGGPSGPPGPPPAQGRVATRINLAIGRTRFTPLRLNGVQAQAGWEHVVHGHFNRVPAPNRSVFTITPQELRELLQSKLVVSAPVTAIPGGQFVRTVDAGVTVGISSLKLGGRSTSQLKVFTDSAGNLITAYPN